MRLLSSTEKPTIAASVYAFALLCNSAALGDRATAGVLVAIQPAVHGLQVANGLGKRRLQPTPHVKLLP
jgi:hypothetical protein